jgi:ATP-dependent 26S proteasome regulatory subunit
MHVPSPSGEKWTSNHLPSSVKTLMELISGMSALKLVLSILIISFLGMFAIRIERDFVIEEDFFKAARKIKEAKKLESKMEY